MSDYTTGKGENFVLAGITVEGDDRIIFIDTDAGFRLLAKSTLWYVGTGLVLHSRSHSLESEVYIVLVTCYLVTCYLGDESLCPVGVTLFNLFLKEFPLGAVTIELSKEFHGSTTRFVKKYFLTSVFTLTLCNLN